jgi:Mg2+/Co2+ transporter CorC
MASVPAIIIIALGLAMLWASSYTEACCRRSGLRLMRDSSSASDEELVLLLGRMREAMAATRIGRFIGLLLGGVGLLVLSLLHLSGHVARVPAGPAWLPIVASALCLVLLLQAADALAAWSEARAAKQQQQPCRRWLTEERREPLPLCAILAPLWTALAETGRIVFRPFNLPAPRGVLYLVDGTTRLAAGEREVSRLTQSGADEDAGPRLGANRTVRDMIRAINRLDRTLVRAVMRPIHQVTALPLREATPERLRTLARATGYTRFPVYEDSIMNLVGYINIYDVLRRTAAIGDLRSLVRQALVVPELAPVDQVLRKFAGGDVEVAICFDEFGASSGWLTREDIIEEIVGEIEEEHERKAPPRTPSIEGRLEVDGQTGLEEIAEETGFRIEHDTFETIAGFIYAHLGAVPRQGEIIEQDGWKVIVVEMHGHRIRRVALEPPAGQPGPAES